jgi:hypothetical protein
MAFFAPQGRRCSPRRGRSDIGVGNIFDVTTVQSRKAIPSAATSVPGSKALASAAT